MSMFVEYTERQWRSLNMRSLKVDEAYLNLHSDYGGKHKNFLYTLNDACFTCPYTKAKEFGGTTSDDAASAAAATIKVNIAHALNIKVYDHDQGRYAYDNNSLALCTKRLDDLQEFGVYNLTLEANGTCAFAIDKHGVNVNYSLLSVFVLFVIGLSLLRIGFCAWQRYHYDEANAIADSIDEAATKAMQRKRMRSLDAFRGLAIVLMIFVNSGGGDYWWIDHAAWNGLHLADIVFPSFLWIMGVCIPLSVKSQLSRGTTKTHVCTRIIWRAFKLFAIGFCLNSINGPQLENIRIMGVLQRFGIAFLVCGVIHTIFSKGNAAHIPPQSSWQRSFYDLILFRGELIVMLALIATYLGITFGLYVPECPRGYLGPGGMHAQAAYPNCTGGATAYIDRQILTNAHLYQHSTAKHIYDSQAFDPEGVFGCLLTIVQVLLGALGGMSILVQVDWQSRVKRWLTWSVLLGLVGGALCGFSKEHGVIPINKNLWSLSFVFVTAALAFSLLALLYYIIDVRQWWIGYPFVECGMNAIIMYVGHTIMHKMLPWHWRLGAMNTHFVLLLEASWNTVLWIMIALILDSHEFYYSL